MTQLTQPFLDDSTQILDGTSDNKSLDDQELDKIEEIVQQTRHGITIEHLESYEYVQQILTQFVQTNNHKLDQETKDKVTNAIAHKDSNKSFNQLKEVTRELDIKKHIHFGGVHVTVYKELYREKEYQSIFASLMDQLDQQLLQSQEAQKTPPRKPRSSLDHKKIQAKPMAKSN